MQDAEVSRAVERTESTKERIRTRVWRPPFLPILQFFRVFYGITEQDSEAAAREKITGRMVQLDERFQESLPLVFDFLGVSDPEHPSPRMDPDARQRQLFAVVRGVRQAGGERGTTVTLLEDLQWFDASGSTSGRGRHSKRWGRGGCRTT
jgi:hypothetical protein